MNILFCGDENAEDGVLISTLSLIKNSGAKKLHLYILTMDAHSDERKYHSFSMQAANYIRSLLTQANPNNTLQLIDCTELFEKQPPTVNMNTRFTPYAMLRLFADQLPEIPDRILYLDDDIIIRSDITEFYQQDMTGIELAGVLDYWGKFFFHNVKTKHVFDYLNSGVLLLNMPKIKETDLFAKVRQMMQTKKMFLPDQSAINKLAVAKRVFPRYYNEQYKLQKNTKIQHFTTSFRFWPYFHTQTVKLWDVDRVHSVLHLHEYDDILTEYLKIRHNLKK